jgi:hypothetical protein
MNQPTGLRLGEAAALRMSDADVPARRIRGRVSVSYVRKTGRVEGPTKNHTARAVPAFLARLLETEIADRDGDALVFTSARGGCTPGPWPISDGCSLSSNTASLRNPSYPPGQHWILCPTNDKAGFANDMRAMPVLDNRIALPAKETITVTAHSPRTPNSSLELARDRTHRRRC